MRHNPLPGELLAWEILSISKSAVKDNSAWCELFGAIQGSSCQDNSLGVFCLTYHKTIQQPPGVISLFLLTAYPLPFLSFPLSEMDIIW